MRIGLSRFCVTSSLVEGTREPAKVHGFHRGILSCILSDVSRKSDAVQRLTVERSRRSRDMDFRESECFFRDDDGENER